MLVNIPPKTLNYEIKPQILKPVSTNKVNNADTVSFTSKHDAKNDQSDKPETFVNKLIALVKLPLMMIKELFDGIINKIKSVFSKEELQKYDDEKIARQYDEFVGSKFFPYIEKVLDGKEPQQKMVFELSTTMNYNKLTDALEQAHKLQGQILLSGKIPDEKINKSMDILKEAALAAQSVYVEDIKLEVVDQISYILDTEIAKLPLNEDTRDSINKAREKMDDDKKFFETIFIKAFRDLKPAENLAYECHAFNNNWH
ncbi:MAG: hypothetical protein AB7V50_06900 [Vampirovibrionia bacterium]